jgi:aerobic-type carbon monoxide dehydrogenase small subunit (CoxS/CutS family)
MSAVVTGPLRFTVNGREETVDTAPEETLAFVLRERLRLTGTKVSCDVQVCGSCTVLVDDLPVSACTYLAYEARGRSVTTVEGLAGASGLSPLQRAFLEENAFQCGFCTSGMLMAAEAYVRDGSDADGGDAEILEHLSGNICRCTGYIPIVAAVLEAARR